MRKKIDLMLKLSFILITLGMMNTETVFANSEYYLKINASAVADPAPEAEGVVYGKVSISNTNTKPADAKFSTTFSTTFTLSSSGAAGQSNYYLWATVEDPEYVFVKWERLLGSSWKVRSYQQNSNTGYIGSATSKQDAPREVTYRAVFMKKGAVWVTTSNEAGGNPSIDKVTNSVGDVVTLTAHPHTLGGKFLQWEGPDGNVVSTDKSYTFTVTDENKGEYKAVFSTYDYANNKGPYVAIVSRPANHTNQGGQNMRIGTMGKTENNSGRVSNNAVMLYDNNSNLTKSQPAFVLQLKGKFDGKGNLYDVRYLSQGYDSYNISQVYCQLAEYGDMQYNDMFCFRGQAGGTQGFYCSRTDYGNENLTVEELYGSTRHPVAVNSVDIVSNGEPAFWWRMFVIDEDETENGFGAMPNANTTMDGKYYVTMYTAFPYKCIDGVKAYVVDHVSTSGKAHLKWIGTDEVPAQTPVVLECDNLLPMQNRLIPLIDEPAALGSDIVNLLQGAEGPEGELWMKDYKKATSTYRTKFDGSTMRVLSYQKAAFVNVNNSINNFSQTPTVADHDGVTYLQNNIAYLVVPEDTPAELTLTKEDLEPALEMEEGYYRLTASDGTMLHTNAPSIPVASAASDAHTSPSTIFYLKADGDNESFLIRSTPQYIRSQGKDFATESSINDISQWTLTKVDDADNYLAVKPSSVMVGHKDGHYYTSFYADFPFEVKGEGMRVWGISGSIQTTEDGVDYVTPTEITGIVPPRTPVVIECVSLDPQDNIILPVQTPFETEGTSMLKGNFFNAAANNDAFIYHAGMEEETTFTRDALRAFGYNSDDPYNPIGFYRFGGSTLGGNKAFIVLDEGSTAANIVIGDFGTIDGLRVVKATDTTDGPLYDLQGRRVQHPTHGVYIQNGKKIVVR